MRKKKSRHLSWSLRQTALCFVFHVKMDNLSNWIKKWHTPPLPLSKTGNQHCMENNNNLKKKNGVGIYLNSQ